MPDRQYDANDYTVGWVCVLVLEMAAAKAMLDEIHPNLSEQAPADHNSYLLGRVQGHNVAIACVPVGMYGTTTAATVVKDMLRTFKSIRFGLLVGIGSGAPSSRHDIRLGDIVVSQLSETTGGVIKYDLGKNGREGQFERTGLLNTPPKILLTALGRLQADHYVRDSRVPEFLAESLQKYPKMKKSFSSRGELTDCLFEAEYEHAGDNTGCEQCDHARSVQRDARKNTDPVVHYGNIASGNLVIKNAGIRDQLSKDLGVLCFEMEAAGLMQDFPCLVIRGICDYADTHKNKEWQGYAAVVAAAFAKELLSVISPECVLQEKAIPQQDSGDTRYENDKQIECHRAFKTSRYEDFKNINPDRVPGTCKWVLEHPKYQKWRRSSRDDILWISADPGYGKSVLAKALIDEELDNAGDYTVCYFFFKDNEDQHSLSTALCAVLYQLFGRSPHLLRHATNAFEKHGQKLQNEVDELWRIFLAAATDSSANAVICVLDALDECQGEDRRKLVRLLTDFYYRRTSASTGSFQLKLLVTSRPYQDIETGFNHIPSELPLIRLAGEESNANLSEEINLVIRQKIAGAGDTLHPDQDVRDALQQKLLATENRTYLWLHLIWDELEQSRKHTKKAFLKKIGSLPSTVEDAYERILTRNSRGDQEEAKVLLHIVIGARRPLRVREMDVAFQLAVESLNGLQHQDLDLDSEQLKARIRELCGPIVLINNNRVHLINQTAKEFLIAKEASDASANGSWRHSLSERQSSKIMAEVCIQYLIFHDIKDERYRERKSNGILIDNFPLLEYASVNWPTHYRDMDEAGVGLFSADHPSTLTSIRRLASIYKNQGRWLEAEKLEVQVMETSMTKLGTDHPSTLTSMTSLALIYSNRGRLTEAETLHLRVIDAFMTQLGPDHPDTLTGMADLAIIYTSQGRWDDAELLQVRVLESVRKVLGEEHPSTLSALANLASTFQKQSRWKEAEELFLRVIQTKKVVFGEAHPETLNSTVRLVLLLEASGRYKEAKDYLENILQLQERFLGFHHASTISTRLMRESLVLAMGRHQPTRTEYSNSTSSEVPDSVWTAGDISTVPTDQSIVSRDRLTNKEFAPLTFFNYKLSGGGPRLDRPFDDVESVNSIADDIQSLDGSPSETETAVVSYVVKTLTADSQLFGLYREATQRLEEAKFIRNHRRLLKLFYLDLLPEGRTRQQQVAISFLRSRVARTRVSQDIYKTLNPMDRNEREKVSVILQQQRDTAFLLQRLLDGLSYETPNSMPDTTPSDTRGAVTDDIDVDCETSGSSETSKDSNLDTSAERSLSFPNLDAIGVFLTHGRPFDLFKENIRQFLHSRPGVYNDRYEFQLESMLHASSDEAPSQADLQHQSMDVLVPIPKASEETKVTQNATQDAPNLDDVTAITAGPADTACFPPFIQTAKGLMDQTNKISKNAGYNGPSRLNERLACLTSELNHARPQRIDVECHLSVSWPDKLKLGLENFTQEAWNWWPLSPPRKPLKSGEVRLRWFCSCHKERWENVPETFGRELVKLIERRPAFGCFGSPQFSNPKLASNSLKAEARGTNTLRRSLAELELSNTDFNDASGPSVSLSDLDTRPTEVGSSQLGTGNASRPSAAAEQQRMGLPNPATPTAPGSEQDDREQRRQDPSRARYIALMVNSNNLRLHQIQVNSQRPDTREFARELQNGYYGQRGFWRYWFSIRRFSHCNFAKFEKFLPKRFSLRGCGLPEQDTQHNESYYYVPRPAECEPPISPEEFKHIYHQYRKPFIIRTKYQGLPLTILMQAPFYRPRFLWVEPLSFADAVNRQPTLPLDTVPRIPQRLSYFNELSEGRMPLWGIHAVEEVSACMVFMYVLLCVSPALGFCFAYMFGLKSETVDLQNPTTPLVISLTSAALFISWLKK